MCRMIVFVQVVLFLLSPHLSTAQTGPELVVSAPAPGTTISGTDVTVAFQVSGLKLVPSSVPLAEAGKRPEANRPGEGHLHFLLDLQPIVVWDRDAAYTFNNITPGEHQLMVELVNNDHSPLSPPVVKQISFRSSVMMPQTGWQREQSVLPWLVIAAMLLGAAWLVVPRSRLLLSDSSPDRRDK